MQDIDAGFKSGEHYSDRKRLLTREDDELVTKTLDSGLGVGMDWEILNHKRVNEGRSKVDETTVHRSDHIEFGDSCHNRPLNKQDQRTRKGIHHIHPITLTTVCSKW